MSVKKPKKAPDEEPIKWGSVENKLSLYMIHKLLWECKQNKLPDVAIWTHVKEMFQSADYGLQMELRPINMVWGDTTSIDNILKDLAGANAEA